MKPKHLSPTVFSFLYLNSTGDVCAKTKTLNKLSLVSSASSDDASIEIATVVLKLVD